VKVVVLTTSYPRSASDFVGRFVAQAVEHLRARGVEVTVLAPGGFRDWGLGDGRGIMRNLRARPWLAPFLLGSMTRALRRAARAADLVHAHWLPSGAVATLSGKPFVVTLHGSDVELARRAPPLARAVLRRAGAVICVSSALAEEARRLGAENPRVIPNGVELPVDVGEEAQPPEVLFAGRLSAEKGIEDLVAVADGLHLVVAGDGPLRQLVPGALGMVGPEELSRLYTRAAVFACPSRREGFGVACAEAMAHGRPAVASAVGGLLDLVVDGETGLLVEPGDRPALRAAIDRLLGDRDLRARLGAAARKHVAELCDWDRITTETIAAYRAALSR
jgi:glycosyltransferase involved in cell wall biosynthesis